MIVILSIIYLLSDFVFLLAHPKLPACISELLALVVKHQGLNNTDLKQQNIFVPEMFLRQCSISAPEMQALIAVLRAKIIETDSKGRISRLLKPKIRSNNSKSWSTSRNPVKLYTSQGNAI